MPQVLVWLKSPVTAIVPTVADVVPVLVTVTAWAALVAPVATDPNDTAAGLTLTPEMLSGRYGGSVGVGHGPQ